MLKIGLQIKGGNPSVLEALADPRLQDKIVKAAAESYVDDTLDWIEAGHAFTTQTGQLEQSIGWRPAGDGTAEVYANAEYASFVEEGTAPHVIEPKPGRKALKIPVPGAGYILRRRVNHPGSRPHPYFFADRDNREQHMHERALSVLAAYMEQHGG